MKKIVMAVIALAAGVAGAANYYWNPEVADGEWKDAANWCKDASGTAATDYPKANDAIFFTAGQTATIRMPDALTINTLNVNVTGLNLTFVGGTDGTNKLLKVGNNYTFGADCTLTLDNFGLFRDGDVTFGDNTAVVLRNSAFLRTNKATFNSGATLSVDHSQAYLNGNSLTQTGSNGVEVKNGGYLYLTGSQTLKADCPLSVTGGSTLYCNGNLDLYKVLLTLEGDSLISASQLSICYPNRTLTIDDSTLEARSHCRLGNTAPGGGTILFKGTAPRLIVRGVEFSYQRNNGDMTAPVLFSFEVPAGGYAEAPVQHVVDSTTTTFSPQGNCKATAKFAVAANSPALTAGRLTDTALILSVPGVKMSRADVTDKTGTLRFTQADGVTTATTDAAAKSIRVTVGSGTPSVPTVAASAVSSSSPFVVSRKTLTVSALVTKFSTVAAKTVAKLVVGEAADGSDGEVVATAEVTGQGIVTLTWVAPAGCFDLTYYAQVVLEDLNDADAVLSSSTTGLKTVKTLDKTTYTWIGGDMVGDWEDPANWDDGHGGDSLGYPYSAAATAKFAPTTKARVRFNSQHTIGTLDLSSWGVDVTFVQDGTDVNGTRLTAGTVTLTGGDSTITLDNVALSTLSPSTAVTLGGSSKFIITHGADFYSGSFTYNKNARMLVLDGATVSVNETTCYGSSADFAIITISNATYKSRNSCYFPHDLSDANVNGSIRLEGTHPVFQMAGANALFKSSKAGSATHIDFLVPEGGYESAPIQCASMPSYLMGNSGGNAGSATIAVNILAESPAALKDGSVTTKLISWPKGINKEMIVEGTAPNASAFTWGEGTNPTTLDATVVGVTIPPPAPVTGTATWIGGGENALASNPANWRDGQMPQTGMDVVLGAEGTDSPMTWDAGMKGVKPASWTQDGYTNTVTFETVFENRGDFNELEVTGNVALRSGKWMSAYNISTMPGNSTPGTCYNKFRLKAKIGGNLTVGADASIDATGCGGDLQPVQAPQFDGGTYGGPGGRLAGYSYVSQTLYGSITEPVHLGAKGNWGVGGGAIYLTVGGATQLDGSLKANSVSNGHYPGSGGSVFLKTGTIAGTGTIAADGYSTQASGSGGRVAVILTATGADFSNFDMVNQTSAVCPSTGKNRGASGTIYAETPANRKDHGWLIMKDYGAGPLDLDRAMRITFPGASVCDYDRLTLTNNACVRFAAGETLVLTNTVLEISDVAGKENGFWFAGGKIRLSEDAEEWNISYPVQIYSPLYSPYLPVNGRDIHVAAKGSLTFNSVVSDLGMSLFNEGTLKLNGTELRVRRNWTNHGTFVSSGDSTVRFVDAAVSSVVKGNSAFELLVCEAPGKSIAFEAGSVQTVTRSFLMNGGEGESVKLARDGKSGSWGLNVAGDAVVFCQNLAVTDSDASSGAEITAYSSEGENCRNWVFAGKAKNTWLGTASADFSDGANWSFGHAPTDGDELEVSSANPMTINCDIRFASITLKSEANVTIRRAVTVAGDVVITNTAVLAWDRPGAVNGNVYVHEGATLTHSENGSTKDNWLELTVAGDVLVASGGAIDVSEKGFSGANKGPGAPSANRGSSYGGRGYPQDNNPTPSCYGSICCPDQLGSSGNWSGPGGGAVKLTVGGTLSVNGSLKANGGSPQTTGTGHYDGTGGSIWLTARRMEGEGPIQARNKAYEAAGGRIALYLTGEGETFETLTGAVDAKSVSSSSGGTVYYQLAGQEPGTGRIVISGSNADGVNSASIMTDVPSSRLADADEFTQQRRPTLEIGNGAANITADIHLADLVLTGGKGAVRLNGHTVFVYAKRHALGTDEAKQIIPGGTEENPGQIIWVPRGLKIMIR